MKKLRIVEDVLKCKWTTSIVDQLGNGIRQPGHLQRSIHSISKKVMYERLKKLKRFNLVSHHQVSAKPLKVYYRLTPMGRRIHRIIRAIKALNLPQ